MNSVSFSAPGKLVIAGEYAVLEGYEAMALSINRRAHVRVKASAQDALRKTPNKLLKSIVDEFNDRGQKLPSVALNLDSSQLHLRTSERALKLGLGSSSAIAVALTAALLKISDQDPHDCFQLAFGAHRRFNNNRGSGIDVATSRYGGALRYTVSSEGPKAKACSLNFDTRLLVPVYTGIAQSTGALLEKLSEPLNTLAYQEAIDGIGNAARRMIDIVTNSGSFKDLGKAVEEHNYWMGILGSSANAEIMATPHLTLEKMCSRYGGFAKPSGAGGGDISLCFVPLDAQPTFRSDLCSTSFQALDLDFCVSGLESV